MARRRLEGLERVLGANALFSTAYGNVGSSIYYALGLVASYALGLTPVVFVITGFFFFCTAATYAEATTMYPEAGGSASFARRAFNEFVSFFAAWTGMLTYVCTIAISAFFVPHYIGGLFWEELRHGPGDVIGGAIVIVVLAAINVFGAKESTGVNVLLAVIDFMTQLLLVLVGAFLVFSPETLVDNVHLGVAPEWKDFALAIPIGMLAYTGIETISNMSEEARDEAKTIPAAINRVRLAVFAIYFTLPAVALSALPVQQRPDGSYYTLLGLTEEEGGFAGDPILGARQADRPRAAAERGGDLRRPAGGDDPLPGHQRRASSASRGSCTRWASTARCPTRCAACTRKYRTPWIGILVFSVLAILILLPGQETFIGSIYSFGALLSFTIAHVSVARLRAKYPDFPRSYRGPGTCKIGDYDAPLFALLGGSFTGLAFVVITILNPTTAAVGARLDRARDGRLPGLPAPPRARPDLHAQGRDPAARRRPRGGVRLRAGPGQRRLRRARDGHRDQARRPQAARHPRGGVRHRPVRAADRRADGRRGVRRPVGDRAGPRAERQPRVRAHASGSGRARRGAASSRRRSTCAPPRSCWRCRAASTAPRCSARRSRPCWPSARAGS